METTEELFLTAFEGDEEDERAWSAVRTLRQRNTDEVFRMAAAHCQSEVPRQRARALDVLAQLGAGKPIAERPHFYESVAIAVAHLHDDDLLVVYSAAWALAHLNDGAAVAALIEVRRHPDTGIRQAVAVGMANSSRPEATAALIELMEDEDDEVRNWATFELGEAYVEDGSGRLGTLDSIEIRDALRKRLDDSFDEAREEAIWGLARRKDREGLRLLLERLSDEERVRGDEMAAAEVLDRKNDTPIDELRKGLRSLIEAV